jgi:methylmalonyl-CoA carboxyltransferase small subunit
LKLKITVNGKGYEVEVDVSEPEAVSPAYVPPIGQARIPAAPPAATPPPKAAGPSSVADEGKVCRSPIAGTVAKIPIQVGQTIKVNDPMVVLEAMKMETVITTPIAGKVAKINANVGDLVQSGQVLVEFE